MIARHHLVEIELMEEPALCACLLSHHRDLHRQQDKGISVRLKLHRFCNRIGEVEPVAYMTVE